MGRLRHARRLADCFAKLFTRRFAASCTKLERHRVLAWPLHKDDTHRSRSGSQSTEHRLTEHRFTEHRERRAHSKVVDGWSDWLSWLGWLGWPVGAWTRYLAVPLSSKISIPQ